jgi:glycosyltransferase involved in cell wall biosynthesis
LKIAFVSQPFDGVRPPLQNSVGISIYELARRLARDHDVTVFTQHRTVCEEPIHEDGVHYRYVPVELDRWLHRQYDRLSRWLRKGRVDFSSRLFYLPYALRVAAGLRRGRFDVIHLLNFSQFAPIVRALNPRSRIVLNMRCEWLSQLDHATVAARLRGVDLVVGCSEHITARVRDRFPDLASRCRTVYNGVDTRLFHPTEKTDDRMDDSRPLLLFVGRVSPEKGVHVLIEALPAIKEQVPELAVEIVGGLSQLPYEYLVGLSEDDHVARLARFYRRRTPDEYIGTLREWIVRGDLNGVVTFTGALPYADVIPRLQRAAVLVNPSLSDAFPRSPVEAMACGVPVVAARIGGVVESVVDGETGFLVAPGDPSELAAALTRLLADRSLRYAMGVAARRRCEEVFSWEKVAEAWATTYRKLVAER